MPFAGTGAPGRGFAHITAGAVVPEHLVPYVRAMADSAPLPCGGSVAYLREGHLVLVAYPPVGATDKADGSDEATARIVDGLTSEALAVPGLERITVLAPVRPGAAPADASFHADRYWELPLPLPPPGQKLRNLLARSQRDITFESGPDPTETGRSLSAVEKGWTSEHAELTEAFARSRPLAPGTVQLFRRIGRYLDDVPGARLFSARSRTRRQDGKGRLEGFCVGDFSALATAFYMFAFRRPQSPPGTADALLGALAAEAGIRGHVRLNLGLGINPGIEFFKRKWGARPFLPCTETTWETSASVKPHWWRRWL